MLGGDVPTRLWALNVAAVAVGLAVATFTTMRRTPDKRLGLGWGPSLVVVTLLAATLIAQGTEGVHRWLPLGPVQLHAGALLLPPLLVALLDSRWGAAVVTAFAVQVALLLQPDAAQAGAFCAAWLCIVATRREKGAAVVTVVSILLAALCVLRLDPLEPVPHVEGIVGMAAAQGPILAVSALVSLAVLPLAQAWSFKAPLGLVLAIYTTGLLLAARLGHHPVPVLGYGISPILGYYGAVAAAGLHGRLGSDTSDAAPARELPH